MRWIIGDVHGMLKPLATLVNEISKTDRQATLYFVGDYVNRGPESRGVVELLITLTNARFIRGNHDDVLDQILHGAYFAENPSRGDRFMAFQWFLEHGLFETLTSYGVTREMIGRVIRQRSNDAIQVVFELFPESHRQFIRSLPVFIEDDDLFLVHGKWPLRESRPPSAVLSSVLHPQLRHELLWGRFTEAELQKKKSWPKVGFFGHTPVPTYRGHENDYSPIVAPKMILLDTAAALSASGRLTAMCAETSQIIQADPAGKVASPATTAALGMKLPPQMIALAPHRLNVVLLQPQIAPNTGNVARLCVATGAPLHLVRPLGFVLSDRELRRSAMDYWPRLKLTLHDDTESFFKSVVTQRLWLFSSRGKRSLWQADFQDGDWLIFGSETKGIDDSILAAHPDRSVRIPQAAGERCLNLSTAVGIALYEGLRQISDQSLPT